VIPEWTAQIVSVRPITPADIAVPLLYVDRVVLHDFGTLITNVRNFQAIAEGAAPNLFPISPELSAQARGDGVISYAGSYTVVSIAYFQVVYWLGGKVIRKEMTESQALEELDNFIQVSPEKFGSSLDEGDIRMGRVIFEWGGFESRGLPKATAFISAFDKLIDHALKQLSKSDHRLVVPVGGNIPLTADTIRGRAATLADAAIKLVVPRFEVEHLDQVYELREQLRDELSPFRAAMLSLTDNLKEINEVGEGSEGLHSAARDVVERHIEPVLLTVERRLREEQGNRRRRLIKRLLGWIPLASSTLVTPSPASIIQLAGEAVGTLDDVVTTRSNIQHIRHDMGVGFLMKLSETYTLPPRPS
jgi:hypothetical protein